MTRKIDSIAFIFIITALVISLPSNAQWIQSNSTPVSAGANFQDVDFPDPAAAYITGVDGILYKSIDGGISWSEKYSFGVFSNLTDPNFINADTGYVTANSGVFRTFDGGSSWSPISFAWGHPHQLPIKFIKLTGQSLYSSYVSNDTTYIIMSDDFGDHFSVIYEHYQTNAQPFTFSFIDDLNGYFINPHELEQVYKTVNGCLTVDTLFITTGPISLELKYDFTDIQNGYLYGSYGSWSNPSRTWNTGTFYFPVDLDGFGVLPVLDLDFNTSKLFASSLYGKIFYSIGNGQNWVEQTTPVSLPVVSISFANENQGIAVSGNAVLYTNNAGEIGTGEFELENSSIKLYPNPAQNTFSIKTAGNIRIEQVKLFDQYGKLLKIISDPDLTVNISDLPTGVYYVEFVTQNGRFSEKILKM